MLLHDVRHAARWLRANPTFTAAAVGVLALGIGAATATFTVLHAVVLRPLPFDRPDRIVRIWSSPQGRDLPFFSVSAPDAADWASRTSTLSIVAPYERQRASILRGGSQPEEVMAARVSRELFELLGVAPLRGRWFADNEDQPGAAARVAVISHGVWLRRFGARADVVGEPLQLDDEPWTVIGVMPPGFAIPNNPAEIWTPLRLAVDPSKRSARSLRVLARLRDGVSIEQASTELVAIAGALAREYPASNATWTVTVRPLTETVVSDTMRRALLIVAGAVALVLLIACANVAGLLLSRAAGRTREMAVRTALGASRGALVRQMLVESLMLAVLGGLAGLLFAMWTLDGLRALALTTIPRADEIALRPAVVLFALGAVALTAVLSAVAPALKAARARADALRNREPAGGRGASRVRDVLVVAEVALAIVLLAGAGVMTRSFLKLQQRDLGFDPDGLLTLQVAPPPGTQAAGFYDALIERLGTLPGVRSVAGASSLPFAGPNSANSFEIEGRTFAPGDAPDADFRVVTPAYFTTLGIPMVRGRALQRADAAGPPVVVVSAAMAKRFFDGNAVGERVRFPGEPWMTIVGVAGDARYFALDDPRDEVRPMMYVPYGSRPVPLAIALRLSTPAEGVVAAVRGAVASIAPGQPVARLETMADVLAETRGPQRFNAMVLGAFAWMALVLAAAGLWGLIAHGVTRRTHEIGVRVALGARPVEVLRTLAGHGLALALLGVALGLAIAAAGAGMVQRVLFDTAALDPTVFALIAIVFLVVAAAASVLPASRALRIDPVEALRSE